MCCETYVQHNVHCVNVRVWRFYHLTTFCPVLSCVSNVCFNAGPDNFMIILHPTDTKNINSIETSCDEPFWYSCGQTVFIYQKKSKQLHWFSWYKQGNQNWMLPTVWPQLYVLGSVDSSFQSTYGKSINDGIYNWC